MNLARVLAKAALIHQQRTAAEEELKRRQEAAMGQLRLKDQFDQAGELRQHGYKMSELDKEWGLRGHVADEKGNNTLEGKRLDFLKESLKNSRGGKLGVFMRGAGIPEDVASQFDDIDVKPASVQSTELKLPVDRMNAEANRLRAQGSYAGSTGQFYSGGNGSPVGVSMPSPSSVASDPMAFLSSLLQGEGQLGAPPPTAPLLTPKMLNLRDKTAETGRHNLTTEGETGRHNTATERETGRHNRKTEAVSTANLTQRQKEFMQRVKTDWRRMTETERHNRKMEAAGIYGINQATFRSILGNETSIENNIRSTDTSRENSIRTTQKSQAAADPLMKSLWVQHDDLVKKAADARAKGGIKGRRAAESYEKDLAAIKQRINRETKKRSISLPPALPGALPLPNGVYPPVLRTADLPVVPLPSLSSRSARRPTTEITIKRLQKKHKAAQKRDVTFGKGG